MSVLFFIVHYYYGQSGSYAILTNSVFHKLLYVLYSHTFSCRFLAKILVPEGSKDVPVGQPIAVTVTNDNL